MIGRGLRESGVSLSFDSVFIKHNKAKKNATRKEIGREPSREVSVVSINITRTVLGTDAHRTVLHTNVQWKVVVELCDKAGHI